MSEGPTFRLRKMEHPAPDLTVPAEPFLLTSLICGPGSEPKQVAVSRWR
jgi:hypothetical protein